MPEIKKGNGLDDWWPQLIQSLQLPAETQATVLNLQVTKEGGRLFADTPDGRREVYFSTVNCQTGVGYTDDKGKIHFFPIPNLPWKEITRGGTPDKRSWAWNLAEI